MIKKDNLKKALNELNSYKKIKNKKYNFYSFDNAIKNYNFDIFFSVATRTAGKTTACQRDIVLEDFCNEGKQFVKLCRYKDDLRPIYQSGWWTECIMSALHKHDVDIIYKAGKYYINERNIYLKEGVLQEREFIKNAQILGYVIPIMRQQAYKSINYENCKNVIFDEFAKMNDYAYDYNEIDEFKSVLSTIVRLRNDVKLYLIGNVLSPYNPYFNFFGVDALKLESGKMYTFADYKSYTEPCIIGLEFGENVTKNIDDIPRLLRIPDNNQVTGMDKYDLPDEVIKSDDWFLILINDYKKFFEHYDVKYKLITSIDDTKILKKYNEKYKFKYIAYYYIEDIYNQKIYLVQEKDSEEYGLSIKFDIDLPIYKYLDDDIRNHYPIFDSKKFLGKKIIFGSIEIYKLFLERGFKK